MSLTQCPACGETHDPDRTCAGPSWRMIEPVPSEAILRLVHAFADEGRKNAIRDLADRVRRLEDFAYSCRDDFDCDNDAHRHGTMCRACAAEKILPNQTSSA